mgnify:CR=1 FL=1
MCGQHTIQPADIPINDHMRVQISSMDFSMSLLWLSITIVSNGTLRLDFVSLPLEFETLRQSGSYTPQLPFLFPFSLKFALTLHA